MNEMSLRSSQLFCRNVLDVLEEREMTITELAEQVDSSRPAISRALHGKDGITLDRADRIAKALKISLSDLLQKNFQIPVTTG